MASAGAFAGNKQSHFVNPESDMPGLDYLVSKQLVRYPESQNMQLAAPLID